MDIVTAQAWAGHTSIKTTTHYNHPIHDDLVDKYEKMKKVKKAEKQKDS
jgi:integrase